MTSDQPLTSEKAAALLRRQDALQAEALHVIAGLELFGVLGASGETWHIGSSVSGLMVWRDIDFNVVAPGLSAAQALATMRPLLIHPRVTQARYINESGPFNETGLPRDERYYFAFYYREEEGVEWKIDVSFWLQDVPRDGPGQLAAMAQRLTEETRLAILWIKDVWHQLPTYRRDVSSMDIYDAVLEHGVRTPAGFDAYLRARGKPTR